MIDSWSGMTCCSRKSGCFSSILRKKHLLTGNSEIETIKFIKCIYLSYKSNINLISEKSFAFREGLKGRRE